MKFLKKIKSITRCPKHKQDKMIANQPSALHFHPVHGDNIRLTGNGLVAERLESFCEGIVFSSRAVRVNEPVSIKFVSTSANWNGALRFGFTTTDPCTLKCHLPKYACPELTSKPGFWAKALSDRYALVENVLTYWADESGKAYYSVNGEYKGIFFSEVDISKPFWALLDIYGSTTAIRFLDSRYIWIPPYHHDLQSHQDNLYSESNEKEAASYACLMKSQHAYG